MQDTNKQQLSSNQQQKQQSKSPQQQLPISSTSEKQMDALAQEAMTLNRLQHILDRLGNGQHLDEKELLATDFNELLDQIISSNQKALQEFDQLDGRLEEIKQWLGQNAKNDRKL